MDDLSVTALGPTAHDVVVAAARGWLALAEGLAGDLEFSLGPAKQAALASTLQAERMLRRVMGAWAGEGAFATNLGHAYALRDGVLNRKLASTGRIKRKIARAKFARLARLRTLRASLG